MQDTLQDTFKAITLWLASGTEAAAALIIGLAAVEATARALLLFVPGTGAPGETADRRKEDVRLKLGRWLAVALEFELAADILRTAVAPTWNEIGQLAAIAVLRTALNYFLQGEIDKAEARRAVPAPAAAPSALRLRPAAVGLGGTVGAAAALIQFGGSLAVAVAVLRGLALIAAGRGTPAAIRRGRLAVADGVLSALGFETAATLLRTIELQSWAAIGLFAAVLALRTLIKRALLWEEARLRDAAPRAAA